MTHAVIQLTDSLDEYVRHPAVEPTDFRRGLHDWLRRQSRFRDLKVVVVEQDTDRRPVLENLWRDIHDATILHAYILWSDGQSELTQFWLAENPETGLRVLSSDREEVERYSPSERLGEVTVPALSLSGLSEIVEARSQLTLCVHANAFPPSALVTLVDRLRPNRILIGRPNADLASCLSSSGFAFAGRPWGIAGSSACYVQRDQRTLRDHVDATVVRAGSWVEQLRSNRLTNEQRRALRRKTKHRLLNRSQRNVVDSSFGVPLTQPTSVQVSEVLAAVEGPSSLTWDVHVDNGESITQAASDCFNDFGLWPLSFSIPESVVREPLLAQKRSHLVSPIVPGYPYAFTDHGDYLSTYSRGFFAVTHRKAGWDCFRHLEILASGAAPLMIDVDDIPPYCMVHYPKETLKNILARACEGGVPSHDTYTHLHAFLQAHLTTRSLAHYALTCTSIEDVGRVLFVDEQHPKAVDYLSTLTLIGLKELLGSDCVPLFPAPWIYSDHAGDVSHLYGRGFGTTRILDPELRSAEEHSDEVVIGSLSDFDTLVVGSISRNFQRAISLSHAFSPARTIWIHGEDSPPLPEELREYRKSGSHLFVRSIHATRS